jgi:hypothetical protein
MGVPATLDWMGFAALSPWMQGVVVVLFSAITFVVARYLLARGLTYIARRTKNQVDGTCIPFVSPGSRRWWCCTISRISCHLACWPYARSCSS